jgi:aldose 1-epimerase
MIEVMLLLGAGAFVACLAGCASKGSSADSVSKQAYGTANGQPVELYTLRNAKGSEVSIMTYGGIVTSLKMPDRNGTFDDIVLGCGSLDGYTSDSYVRGCPYFGALIGRYGNRIGGAKFTLEGNTYTLAANNGPNSLHGGVKGFDKVVWKAVKGQVGKHGPYLELNYLSKDGEEGFPGNLNVTAVYTLTEDNELRLDFTAKTDKATLCNLTHHSYFNLRGQGNGDILGHEVYINADKTTPVNKDLITTGAFAPVDNTPFDFRTTGRVMEVWSTEPGLQFYAGNFLNGSITGKGGKVYQRRTGFCMEPHHYPDSPNKPNFPTTELKPGETYHNTIIYKFSAK